MKKIKLLVAAGGTGGHLFPALAVIEQLEKITGSKTEAVFVGSGNRIESRVVPEKGYKFEEIPISGLTKLVSLNTFSLPLKILKSINLCRRIIKSIDADAVLCAGAYLSYPAGIAAKREKVPLFLMESNVNPGKSIKLLSRRANIIFTSFGASSGYFKPSLQEKIVLTGNPVRQNILDDIPVRAAREKFGLEPHKKTILIFGGSLGARSINLAVEKITDKIGNSDFQMLWQTGKNYEPPSNIPENIKVLKFIDDMHYAYAAADIVISRSGATTVAELCIVGKPSILVPLSSASNNEQYHNAKVLSDAAAAELLTDSEVGIKLWDIMEKYMKAPEILDEMGRKIKQFAKPEAAHECAKRIIEYVRKI